MHAQQSTNRIFSKDLAFLQLHKYTLLVFCRFMLLPHIPPELSVSDQESYATQGVQIKKLDNNDISRPLLPQDIVILAVRTLCTCPPKCRRLP